jgi:HEAT repeat protein
LERENERVLREKEDAEIRAYVVHTLGVLGEKAVVSELLVMLRDKQEDAGVRAMVADALGKLEEKTTVSELLTMLKDKQEDSFVRQSAAEALGKLGEKTAAPDLLTVFKDRRVNSFVRRSVVGALIKLGQRKTVLPYLSVMVEGYLLRSEFMWNIAALRQFTPLLKRRHITYNTYEQFWVSSKRKKVCILMFGWKFIKFVRIVKI